MEETNNAPNMPANDAAPMPPAGGGNDVEANKGIAILSYLGVLCLIPLLAKKDSKFAQYHAKQGLVLFIAEIVLWVVNFVPILGQIVFVLGWIVAIVLVIMGIMAVTKGEMKELPLIGGFADKFNL